MSFYTFLRQRIYVSYWQVSIVHKVHPRNFCHLCMYRASLWPVQSPVRDEKEILILKLQCWDLKKETILSQRLIISSYFEEVWLMYNADAHCTLGKVHHKEGHGACVCVCLFNSDLVLSCHLKKLWFFLVSSLFSFSPFIPCKTLNTLSYPIRSLYFFFFVKMKTVITVSQV